MSEEYIFNDDAEIVFSLRGMIYKVLCTYKTARIDKGMTKATKERLAKYVADTQNHRGRVNVKSPVLEEIT